MHIPDGFLSINTWLPAWIISMGAMWFSIKKVMARLKERTVPLMGVVAAFIFVAQMLNFPVAGGTSGHLLGGVLAGVLLGPWAGSVIVSVVLIVQCLIFQDGGITALGANILNMAILGTMSGYLIYNVLKKVLKKVPGTFFNSGPIFAIAIASWFSVVIASSACAVELAVSGASPFKIVLPAMIGIHMLIGIGEAIITCLVIGFIQKVRPDLMYK